MEETPLETVELVTFWVRENPGVAVLGLLADGVSIYIDLSEDEVHRLYGSLLASAKGGLKYLHCEEGEEQ